jgi:Predicted periplasmic lipoprotein (DUF2291)
MPAARLNSMRTARAAVIALLIAGVVLTVCPPFHVRSLGTVGETSNGIEARPVAEHRARELWQEMRGGRESAVEANTLLEALKRDPVIAERKYGRRIGYGGPAFYFVRGEGRVVETTRNGVLLEIAGQTTKVKLLTGPIFGNALRDATAFADIGEFDSFEFNALSTELNLISERRVQPRLAELSRPAESLRFVGGAKYVPDASSAVLEIVLVDVQRADDD